jgi:methyl-accepting chemotaxis protein
VRQTLNAGGEAATAINTAIKSLDSFVRYVSPPNTNRTTLSTNSQPFNVLDYGTAASQIGAAAKDLNALLASVNQSTPQIAQLSQQTTANAERVVHHAFRLGLALILVLLAGSVLAGLTYRFLASKLTRDGNKPSAPKPDHPSTLNPQ